MDDLLFVSLLEGAQDVHRDAERLVERQRIDAQPLLERATDQQLEDDERRAVASIPCIEHAQRTRVTKAHRERSLAVETSPRIALIERFT